MSADGRRYVDDRAPALKNHVREDRPATEKSAGEIDRKHPVPCLFLGIEDSAVEEDGRAIEKNIKLSMLLEYGLDHAVYLFCLRDVHLDEARATALIPRPQPG